MNEFIITTSGDNEFIIIITSGDNEFIITTSDDNDLIQ